jgi:GTP:adenosylcobinamide-phosphate guanylyltransferase
MDVIVTAGGIPIEGEPLYPVTRGLPKALLEIEGKPMVQWVLDAIGGAASIEQVFLVSLGPEAGLTCSRPLHFIPDQGSLLRNVRVAMARVAATRPGATHVVVCSSDIPTMTSEMVEWRVDAIRRSGAELDYAIIERSTMEATFPGSHRSWVHFKGLEFCSADIHGGSLTLAADEALWEKLLAARKSALKQAALVGLDAAFLLLTRQLTLEGAERMAKRKLGLRAKAHRSPYAELGMDVDKPHQLDMVRGYLAKRRPSKA